MKKMTCKQLGGACDLEFESETFEEMAKLSQEHGMEMINDKAHIDAMNNMRELMKDPEAMQAWMKKKKEEFDNL